jgi:hypothetical protein
VTERGTDWTRATFWSLVEVFEREEIPAPLAVARALRATRAAWLVANGWTRAEVATALGCSPRSVYYDLARVRAVDVVELVEPRRIPRGLVERVAA